MAQGRVLFPTTIFPNIPKLVEIPRIFEEILKNSEDV